MKRSQRLAIALVVLAAGLAAGNSADASEIDLGGGWFVSLPAGVTIPMDNVTITPEYIKLDIVKVISQEPNEFGEFTPLHMFFRKTASAPSKLIIDQELVTNNTGVAWSDFHMYIGFGPAGFNQAESTPLSTDPFTQPATFLKPIGWNNLPTQIDFQGGTVPDGGIFRPGETQGQIVIDTAPMDTIFMLKEVPTTPEPASLLIVACGWLAARRRR